VKPCIQQDREWPAAQGIEGDGVMRAAARMNTGGVHVETHFRVLRNALLQIGHGDGDMVEAGEHEYSGLIQENRRTLLEPRQCCPDQETVCTGS
jgi:hypothetical protein